MRLRLPHEIAFALTKLIDKSKQPGNTIGYSLFYYYYYYYAYIGDRSMCACANGMQFYWCLSVVVAIAENESRDGTYVSSIRYQKRC